MKILLTIHHELDRNAGAPGVTWQLGQEYEKLGHEVEYFSFDNIPKKLPGMAKSIVFPNFVARKVASLVSQNAVDVVDASTGDGWRWAKRSPRSKQNRPLLVTRSHGLEHIDHIERMTEVKQGNLRLSWKYPLYHGGWRLKEVENSVRDADLVLLLNSRDAKYAVENLGVEAQRARIVANGIPSEFLNLAYEPIATENDRIGIAIVGTYIQRKGIQFSSPALNQILQRYPQVKVSFLGTGKPEAEVYADFDERVRDRIVIIPRYNHDDLPNLLRGHQIKLFASVSEGFGLALIEAMACGLAPITTATPGPLEIVRNGEDAIVVPTRDSQAIEQALEKLINDRPYLETLRRNAHATAQRYSWSQIARQNLNYYEEALTQLTT